MKLVYKLNPLTMVSGMSLLALIVYEFKWSSIYPKISGELLMLLILFITASFVMGWFLFPYMKALKSNVKMRSSVALIIFLMLVVAIGTWLDYQYSKGFPLFGQVPYDSYGMPTIHVVTTMLAMFLSFYSMQIICAGNFNLRWVFILFYSLLPNILGLSRGSLILSFVVFLWIYLYSRSKRIKGSVILFIVLSSIVVLYVFGVAGNYRLSKQTNASLINMTDSSLIYEIGSANSVIESDSVMAPFFWSYLYFTSPTANLQSVINNKASLNANDNTVKKLIVTQYFPDALSSHMYPMYKTELANSTYSTRVNGNLTVGTAFYGSYLQAGWLGIFLMMLFLLIFPVIYLYVLNQIYKDIMVLGVSVLNSMYLLIVFDNPWAFSALSVQLFFILIVAIFFRIKGRVQTR